MVLDGFGVGELPDAREYGDERSNTLEGIYFNEKLNLPNMKKMGLYNIEGLKIPEKIEYTIGAYGKAAEQSAGKNSPVGHWEMAGYITKEPFKTYPKAFPDYMIEEFLKETGLPGILCNKVGSGTELLKEYGEEHIKTGYPIIYTSADSVFQVAAHEDIIHLEKLYKICEIARKLFDKKEYNIGTIIARPFIGKEAQDFKRTYNRRDFESENFGETMLDLLMKNQKQVIAIGKINDLFCGRGISKAYSTKGNEEGINKTIEEINKDSEGLIFTNLVDYDMLYGHRNDIKGYARALEYLDNRIPEIQSSMKETDILILTADHGCDPSTLSTNHSREYVPILVYGKQVKKNINLGTRDTYSDISATILDIFGIKKLKGVSFKNQIL